MEKQPPLDQIIGAFSPGNTPGDLLLVYTWMLFAVCAIYLPIISTSPLRVILALPVVLFLPGYALIAALFPSAHDIDGIERLALSFGLSIALVPLIGLVLNYTPWGIRLDPVVISLVIVTLALTGIAQFRRYTLPTSDRFFVNFRAFGRTIRNELFNQGTSKFDRLLGFILIIAIIAALVATIYVVVIPKEGEKFTEFYILGKEGKAAGYPDELKIGRPESVIIGIGNHEYKNMTYGVEILLLYQNPDTSGNTSAILREKSLSRFYVTLPHNSTYQEAHNFSVNESGYNQLKFLLFRDEFPGSGTSAADRINASYRDLHLWINIRPY